MSCTVVGRRFLEDVMGVYCALPRGDSGWLPLLDVYVGISSFLLLHDSLASSCSFPVSGVASAHVLALRRDSRELLLHLHSRRSSHSWARSHLTVVLGGLSTVGTVRRLVILTRRSCSVIGEVVQRCRRLRSRSIIHQGLVAGSLEIKERVEGIGSAHGGLVRNGLEKGWRRDV